jgi:hypothetical protein
MAHWLSGQYFEDDDDDDDDAFCTFATMMIQWLPQLY